MKQRAAVVATASVVVLAFACNGSVHFDETGAGPDGGGAASRCSTNVDCRIPGLSCDTGSDTCVACLSDRECAAPNLRCRTSEHVCVACVVDEDCAVKQRCDVPTGRCLDTCRDRDDVCPEPGFVCNDDKRLCVECSSSANCSGAPGRPRCATSIGICTECTGNAQCPAERPRCDLLRGACVGCVATADCSAGYACDPRTSACAPL